MVNIKVIVLLSLFLAIFAHIYAVALSETNQARCGNDDENGNLIRNKRWALLHHGHKNKTIAYRITKYSPNLINSDVDDVMQRAFNIWTEHTNLKFTKKQANETADIDIQFGKKDHGDSWPFDGKDGVLAHAYRNYAHFDDDETWKVKNSGNGRSLYKVAVHEFGHCLGLGHSDVEAAIMFKNHLSEDEENFKLDDDDIEGIQEIYGDKIIPPTFSEDLCKDPTFDTMFETPDNKTYVFKKDKYYELGPLKVIDGPKPITEKWKGLPDSITAAFSQNGKTFFFKNDEYWSFTEYKMDLLYPKTFSLYYSEIPHNFNDATVWKDGKVYFFRGSKYYRIDVFNEERTDVKQGFLKDDWKGIPSHTDTVHYGTSFLNTFFFKNDSFYSFSAFPDGDEPYKTPTTNYFFGCS